MKSQTSPAKLRPCFLSGSVVAIYGAERNDGKFTVEDFCMADLPQQSPKPLQDSDRLIEIQTLRMKVSLLYFGICLFVSVVGQVCAAGVGTRPW